MTQGDLDSPLIRSFGDPPHSEFQLKTLEANWFRKTRTTIRLPNSSPAFETRERKRSAADFKATKSHTTHKKEGGLQIINLLRKVFEWL
jgi:hypothetical protein